MYYRASVDGYLSEPPSEAWLYFSVSGPTLAAILLVLDSAGFKGLRSFLARLLPWRLQGRMFVLILMLFPAVHIAGAAWDSLVSGSPADFVLNLKWPGTSTLLALAGFTMSMSVAEELGWRGWLQPHLERRMGDLSLCVVVGVIWAAWHAHDDLAYLLAGEPWAFLKSLFEDVRTRCPTTIPLCMIFLWAYRRTNGNLFAMVLIHASYNFCLYTKGFVFVTITETRLPGFYVMLWVAGFGLLYRGRMHKLKELITG